MTSPSRFDIEHINEIMAGRGDWWSAQLLRLFSKADPDNRAKLALAFPEHALLWSTWYTSPDGIVAVPELEVES